MTLTVAVPVKLARLRVWVDKSRRWNAVDRLMLWAIAEKPRTPSELAMLSSASVRLVNQIILRLLQVGWAELMAQEDGAVFHATNSGREALNQFDMLPAVPRFAPRNLNFIIEPFTRAAIPSRDVRLVWPTELDEFELDNDVRVIELEKEGPPFSISDLYRLAATGLAFNSQDEELDRIDFNASTIDNQYALFSVTNSRIHRIPVLAPEELKAEIVNASQQPKEDRLLAASYLTAADENRIVMTGPIAPEDILFTGDEHREALGGIIARASHMIAIHSTFLRPQAFFDLENELRAAVRRGAQIDIFWGAAAGEKDAEKNFNAALEVNTKLQTDPEIRSRIRVHWASTKSHAKLLVADTGQRDQGVAVIGSCNWLYSGFNRFEASLRSTHPHFVAKVARCFGDLVYASVRSPDLVAHLHTFSRDLERQLLQPGEASLELLFANHHNDQVVEARDNAQSEIMITSDRLGTAAEARAIIPLISSVRQNLSRRLVYSQSSGLLTKADAAKLAEEAGEHGVELVRVHKRELHAKVLLWDDDDVVISSLNWSSADARDDAPFGEVGVRVRSPGIATHLSKRILDEAMSRK